MNLLFRIGLALLPALLLAACATTQAPPTSDAKPTGADWRQHAARVATLKDWYLKGRIAVQTADNSGSASLYWRQQSDAFNLRVVAPFGQGTVELSGSENGSVTLVDSDNRSYTAPNPESLMQARLGWSVPVTSLKYWVRGLPARQGEITAATPDSQGRLRSLEQMGWQITVNQYARALERDLPRKLEVSHEQFEARLVVQSWARP